MDETLFRLCNGAYGRAPPAWDFLGGNVAAVLLGLGVVLLMVLQRQARWLLAGALAVALTDPFCARVLKPAVERERPCATLEGVTGPRRGIGGPVHCGAGTSMPSNHAANTAALAAALASPSLAVVAGVSGLSRVVNGQHWPSDVAAGWAVGSAIGVAVRWAIKTAFGWP